MPTLTQVRDRADTWLANRWPTLQVRQAAYLAANGHYWQGLRTHTFEPAHTTAAYADALADLLANHPTDQADNWSDLFPEFGGTAIPAMFVFDVYESPQGHGYVATVYAKYNGTIYSRSQNVGPETERTVAWHVVG